MYYVYLLKDEEDKIYIGYSSNLKERIKEHLKRKVKTTKKMKRPRLIYYEAYHEKKLAKEREKRLKDFGSAYQSLMRRLKLKY